MQERAVEPEREREHEHGTRTGGGAPETARAAAKEALGAAASAAQREREQAIREALRAQRATGEPPAALSRALQSIHCRPFAKRQRQEEARWLAERAAAAHVPTVHPTALDPATGQPLLGCAHYPRNCKLKAACCGAVVTCRLCHEDPRCHHEMVRFDTQEVLCMKCDTMQPVGRRCVKCGTEFARYFCAECKFYDNTPGKDIFHCPRCKICRKGRKADNTHCDKCDVCIPNDHFAMHNCVPQALHSCCPICNGYMHESTRKVAFLVCGHGIHYDCYEEYIKQGNYVCPLCHKTLVPLEQMAPYFQKIDELLAHERMPEEYEDKLSYISCHDCEQRSVVPYHFVFHRCANPDCRSYNTYMMRMFARAADWPPGPYFRRLHRPSHPPGPCCAQPALQAGPVDPPPAPAPEPELEPEPEPEPESAWAREAAPMDVEEPPRPPPADEWEPPPPGAGPSLSAAGAASPQAAAAWRPSSPPQRAEHESQFDAAYAGRQPLRVDGMVLEAEVAEQSAPQACIETRAASVTSQ